MQPPPLSTNNNPAIPSPRSLFFQASGRRVYYRRYVDTYIPTSSKPVGAKAGDVFIIVMPLPSKDLNPNPGEPLDADQPEIQTLVPLAVCVMDSSSLWKAWVPSEEARPYHPLHPTRILGIRKSDGELGWLGVRHRSHLQECKLAREPLLYLYLVCLNS